jgi:DNA processing protein
MSADSQAVLLLCSTLATGRGVDAPKPLSRSEWNDLARVVGASSLRRPGALMGLPAQQLRVDLGIAESLAERLVRLLDRGGQLAIELERLQGLGIWAVTRADDDYPGRLRERLKSHAPAVLFGAGARELVSRPGVAIVGSRNIDNAGAAFASALGGHCAALDVTVVSGGARGVDRLAVGSALEAEGTAVAVLAESLEDAVRRRETRSHLLGGRLALVTPIHPAVKFSVAAAMGRNKLIYALASCAVVVAADLETGGTWAGAIENLRAGWVPLFVRQGDDVPEGNRELINRGASPLMSPEVPKPGPLEAWDTPAGEAPLSVRESPAEYAAAAEPRPALAPTDVFPHVWPLLESYLSVPRTESEVAGAFHLHRSQAKAWLARAVQEGLAKKLTKPVRFLASRRAPGPQSSLFG